MIYFDETGDWGSGKAIERPTKNDYKTNTPFCHAPCMIRTAIIKEVGGYSMDKINQRGQDYYLWYSIYKLGYVGYNLQEPLYKMRDDKNAMKRRSFKHRYYGFLRKKKVLKDLGFKYGFFYALPGLLKGLVPNFVKQYGRKILMKK